MPQTRERIRADIARDGLNNWGRIPSWECVQISISPHLPQYAGRTIGALAAERGQDPIDTLCDYLARGSGRDARAGHLDLGRRHSRASCASPTALVGSDGNCVAPYGTVGKGMPHPRFYGTFPRIIDHYVRERGALPLELAIHKMTGATARALKLKDRGLLKEGYRADVAIFDPADFKDRATYADPHQYPDRRAHHRHRQRRSRGREFNSYRSAPRRGVEKRSRWRGGLSFVLNIVHASVPIDRRINSYQTNGACRSAHTNAKTEVRCPRVSSAAMIAAASFGLRRSGRFANGSTGSGLLGRISEAWPALAPPGECLPKRPLPF